MKLVLLSDIHEFSPLENPSFWIDWTFGFAGKGLGFGYASVGIFSSHHPGSWRCTYVSCGFELILCYKDAILPVVKHVFIGHDVNNSVDCLNKFINMKHHVWVHVLEDNGPVGSKLLCLEFDGLLETFGEFVRMVNGTNVGVSRKRLLRTRSI
jgi:hypothetical protein